MRSTLHRTHQMQVAIHPGELEIGTQVTITETLLLLVLLLLLLLLGAEEEGVPAKRSKQQALGQEVIDLLEKVRPLHLRQVLKWTF